MRDFFRRVLAFCCVMLSVLEVAHVSFADGMTDTEAFFARQETYSGLVDVPGKGKMRYYAQNDPLWAGLAYEKEDTDTRRPFKDSGCSPTAVAMAIASLVPDDQLSLISKSAKRDYSLCSCSLNKARCKNNHARYVLTSERDYVRFLPLVFGDFATGNNTAGSVSRSIAAGTGTGYLKELVKPYGITMSFVSDYAKVQKFLAQKNTAVVGLASSGGAFTSQGHYLFLAAADKEKLYILDPLCRTTYSNYNQGSKLTVIQPGLVSIRHADIGAAKFSNFIVFVKATKKK